MRVTAQITKDINTDRWAQLYDTDGQKASDVRADMQDYMHDAVVAKLEEDGLISPEQ